MTSFPLLVLKFLFSILAFRVSFLKKKNKNKVCLIQHLLAASCDILNLGQFSHNFIFKVLF